MFIHPVARIEKLKRLFVCTFVGCEYFKRTCKIMNGILITVTRKVYFCASVVFKRCGIAGKIYVILTIFRRIVCKRCVFKPRYRKMAVKIYIVTVVNVAAYDTRILFYEYTALL